jgi:glucosamine--fructose-6-phosphate aminotransferase (isomerizing)
MCGIFGIVSNSSVSNDHLSVLIKRSQQRGRDSSGLVVFDGIKYAAHRADYPISKLFNSLLPIKSSVVLGHSRLVTNGFSDNQPVIRDSMALLHNGIVVNDMDIWKDLKKERYQEIDSEVIIALASEYMDSGVPYDEIPDRIMKICQGVVSCALLIPGLGKLCLFSNNGSLYVGTFENDIYFASEMYPLTTIRCLKIRQIKGCEFVDIPVSNEQMSVEEYKQNKHNLIPPLQYSVREEKMLDFSKKNLRRCTRCVLPETMPFIKFDNDGVCNYCLNYKIRNKPKPKQELFDLVEPYRKAVSNDCIIPFSGGRDSCYALHLVVNELKMKPVTYTYDWGMVTDLGRRNISRMCAELGVENIIIADDITKKRQNIAMNLKAWLKSPNLGMISVLTAGDKHFFKHVETIKRQTGIQLNLWGVNPLEVTHFKAGFLGVPPDFEEEKVYSHGAMKQLRYQALRFKAMLESPGYFNSSLWDTLSGEYYRSFTKKEHYYHVFDYWRWDEKLVDDVLDIYDWERAVDTKTTWRIGDGTAAFYNYVYYTVAGFTEHDTFRSNQIREGDITREDALMLIETDNLPRYQNIRWYLDALGMSYQDVIPVINAIPKLY